ncbi:hypothetical protein EDD21DRAFT_372829, partial [Dissophora ornata]
MRRRGRWLACLLCHLCHLQLLGYLQEQAKKAMLSEACGETQKTGCLFPDGLGLGVGAEEWRTGPERWCQQAVRCVMD